jgi:hypothetical protein
MDGTAINEFGREEGELVWHSIGMRCWCTGKNGQVDPTCKSHDVTGSVYGERSEITGLFTDITQRKELAATGLFLPGDALFSPSSTVTVSEGDKITLQKPMPFGSGDALSRGVEAYDLLFYEGVTGIFCMDEKRTIYRDGIDYRLNGKKIEWQWAGKPAEGKAPAFSVRYTVKYRAYIDWIAFFPPMERFSHGTDMGSKVLLRKLHLMGA